MPGKETDLSPVRGYTDEALLSDLLDKPAKPAKPPKPGKPGKPAKMYTLRDDKQVGKVYVVADDDYEARIRLAGASVGEFAEILGMPEGDLRGAMREGKASDLRGFDEAIELLERQKREQEDDYEKETEMLERHQRQQAQAEARFIRLVNRHDEERKAFTESIKAQCKPSKPLTASGKP